MTYTSDEIDGYEGLGCLLVGYFLMSLLIIVPPLINHLREGTFKEMYDALFVFFILTLIIVIFAFVCVSRALTSIGKKLKDTSKQLSDEQVKNNNLTLSVDKYKKLTNDLEALLQSTSPFSYVAEMYATAHALVFQEDIQLMMRRKNKGSTIQLNKARKEEYLELLTKYQTLKYEYDFLISKYFNEIGSRLKSEEFLLLFSDVYTTQEYIGLINDRIKQYKKERDLAVANYDHIHCLLEHSTPFRSSAELIAKIDSVLYDKAAEELRHKQNPANTTADKIEKEFKKEYIKWRTLYEELYAKYQFLCETFPDLKLYIDDEESLIALNDIYSIHDFTDETDRVANYLSKDEWLELTCTQRNQLALDRYIRQNKSDAIIGLEYEMYVAYRLRSNGFKTIPHGILNGVNDLGRDILAWDEDSNVKEVYIIQCKLRSKDNVIHENVICQLYGTAKEYELENEGTIVVPVICTNVSLSDTAKKFADVLQIYQLHKPMKEFPRIKCNINSNGDKIYHLPFDQQYWRTQIKNDGECYAWTVREAEDMGFRRAMRHNPYMNQIV